MQSNPATWAGNFSGKYTTRVIPNLRGGMNDYDDSEEIEDNEMADCENVEISDKNIRSAAGYVDYGGTLTDGPYWGGFQAIFSSGTSRLIRQRRGYLEYDNGSGTWTNCTLPTSGSPVAAVTLSQIPCSFAMLNDIVLWSNGTDSVMSSTDGITWTLRSSLPKSKQLFNNGLNRILYVAQPSAPSRIDWSDINDPLTVGASSYQAVGFNDGQVIEGAALTPSGGQLCFKTNRFYSISDITQGIVSVDPIGEAPCYGGTIQVTENSVIWFGGDAIYEYAGGIVSRISGTLSFVGRLDVKYAYLSTAAYFNQKYRLSIPSSTTQYNFQEYVLDRSTLTGKAHSPYAITRNGRTIGCYIKERSNTSNVRRNRLYIGSSLSGTDYRIFSYVNDLHDPSVTQGLDGSAQGCFFITKFYTENTPFLLKRYVKHFFDILASNTTDITLSYRFDPRSGFIDIVRTVTPSTLDIDYGNGESGDFSEGYNFVSPSVEQVFTSLESSQNMRGVQFKFSWSSIQDVTIFSHAYKTLIKNKFH